MPYPAPDHPVSFLTAEQMRDVDRLVVARYGVTLTRMMENAGRSLALLARHRFLKGDAMGRVVHVLCGKGGNGGGGLVCARHLHNAGAKVHLVLPDGEGAFGGVPGEQLAICRALDLPTHTALPGDGADLIIDSLIGYSLRGAPRGAMGRCIDAARRSGIPTLSLDVPSGLDATTGRTFSPYIQPEATLTLALPKTGLRKNRSACGALYLADISVPREVYKDLGLSVPPLFFRSPILRLW